MKVGFLTIALPAATAGAIALAGHRERYDGRYCHNRMRYSLASETWVAAHCPDCLMAQCRGTI